MPLEVALHRGQVPGPGGRQVAVSASIQRHNQRYTGSPSPLDRSNSQNSSHADRYASRRRLPLLGELLRATASWAVAVATPTPGRSPQATAAGTRTRNDMRTPGQLTTHGTDGDDPFWRRATYPNGQPPESEKA